MVAAADLGQIAAKLAALSDMNHADLRAEWRRLFRSNPPPKIRGDLMVLAIAWKILEQRASAGQKKDDLPHGSFGAIA